jgi:hypothetical protein
MTGKNVVIISLKTFSVRGHVQEHYNGRCYTSQNKITFTILVVL